MSNFLLDNLFYFLWVCIFLLTFLWLIFLLIKNKGNKKKYFNILLQGPFLYSFWDSQKNHNLSYREEIGIIFIIIFMIVVFFLALGGYI